jgi:hypothetical protein
VKAFINIPKRRGSSLCTRNGAILDAINASTVMGLSNAWKLETDGPCSEMDCLAAARLLRERLADSVAELRGSQHASFTDLQAAGVFGGIEVLERRGFWRVEWDVPPVWPKERNRIRCPHCHEPTAVVSSETVDCEECGKAISYSVLPVI